MSATYGTVSGMRLRAIVGAAGTAILLATAALTPAAPPRTSSSTGSDAPLQSLLDSPAVDLPFDPQLAAVSCPVERGPVKEGADADRSKVSTTIAKASITYLRGRPKPSSYPRNRRVTATELHTYQVTVYLTQYKQESDGDLHLVLKDSAGHSMIAEVPYGACVPSTSRWRKAIATARSTFTAHYKVTTSWHYVHRLVDVRGIGYLDPLHGQTGVAPNGVELHPVTYLHFH